MALRKKNKKKDVPEAVDNELETQVLDEPGEAIAIDIPRTKTKKELKEERKQEEERKKQVRLEAKRHSAKRTRLQNAFISIICVLTIICLIACSVLVMKSYKNITSGASLTVSSSVNTGDSSSANTQTAAPAAQSTQAAQSGDSAPAADAPAADSAPAASANPDAANAVEIFKKAHAQALANATKITRTYNNTTNYKEVLEIGNSSVIAGVAKSLMGQFLKEDTTPVEYTGADIAANLPPANGNTDGLTADMLSEATLTDDGTNYIIKLTLNSTEENPDLGEKTKNLCSPVNEQEVMDAAGGFVTLNGLEVRYIAPTVTATVDKATGNLIHLETDVPSYMCFSEAKVAIVSVKDCRIGLEFMMKFDIAY